MLKTLLSLALLQGANHGADGFYLPGVNPYSFTEGET